MEKIDSFVFYRSFFEAAKDLEPADKLAVYDAIFEYVFEKKRKKLSGVSAIILTLVIPNLDAAISNRQNGKKGGRPKKETGVFENKKGGFLENENRPFEKTETNEDVDVNGNGDVNGDVNENVDVNDLPFSDPLPELPKNKKSIKMPDVLNVPEFAEAWSMWLKYRKEIKKPLKDTTMAIQLKKFEAEGVARSIEAINNSIENGWQGLFWDKVKAEKPDEYELDLISIAAEEEYQRAVERGEA